MPQLTTLCSYSLTECVWLTNSLTMFHCLSDWVCLAVSMTVSLSICLSDCLSVCQSVLLSSYLYDWMSSCLTVKLSDPWLSG